MDVQFFALAKRPNSTARPNLLGGSTYTDIQLKGPCSIRTPTIKIRLSSGSDPVGFNYCYIKDFERYYFVNDWVNENYNWYAYLVEDELATWKDAIGSSTQYILRSSYAYDGDIMDEFYPAKRGTISHVVKTNPYTSDLSTGYYVVGILNKDQSVVNANMGAVRYYCFSSSGMRDLMDKLFDSATFADFTTPNNPNKDFMTEEIYKSLFNPIEYITGCMFLPVKPLTGNAVTSLEYGYWTISVSGCEEINLNGMPAITGSFSIPKHPQAATRGAYLNLKPFSSYTLFFQPFGQIPLDPITISSATDLYYWLPIDPVSGLGVLSLYLDSNYTKLIFQQTAQIGIPIALAQMSRDYVGAATSAVGGIAGSLTSGLMGNIVGAIAGGVSAIGNVAQSLMPQLSTQGANGSFAAMVQDTVLLAQFLPIVDEDNADRGRPLCKKATISSYPGYLVVADPDIAINEATREEMDAIRNYMATGFFYE